MRRILLISAAVLLLFTACRPDKGNEDTNLILLVSAQFLMNQDVNCTRLRRTATNSYQAQIQSVPSSACKSETRLGNTRDAGLAAVREIYAGSMRAAQTISGCSATATLLQNTPQLLTVASFCTAFGFAASDCASDAAWAAAVATVQFTTVPNPTVETAQSVTATLTNLSFPSVTSQAANARLLSQQDFFIAALLAYSGLAGEPGCNAAVKAAYPFTNQEVSSIQLAVATDKTAASPPMTSMSCVYGSAAAQTATTRLCATLGPVY